MTSPQLTRDSEIRCKQTLTDDHRGQLALIQQAASNFLFALSEFYRADFRTEADARDKAVAAEEILRHLLPGPPPRLPFERKP